MTLKTLDQKVMDLCALAIEFAADNDESLDKHDVEPLGYQRGYQAIAVAWLSGYDSRGDAPACLQKLIDSHYSAQEQEWARQYPDRLCLYDSMESGESRIANEAEEWLDAALSGPDGHGEAAYLQIEIAFDDDSVYWESRFTNEINQALSAGGKGQISASILLTMDDEHAEKLAGIIAESAYEWPSLAASA